MKPKRFRAFLFIYKPKFKAHFFAFIRADHRLRKLEEKKEKKQGEREHFQRNLNSEVREMKKSCWSYLGNCRIIAWGNAIRHQLKDIVAIGILAILCNANTFVGMRLFGETHEKELREVLELPHGIPSHDVFGDVFSRLDTSPLEQCFEEWVPVCWGRSNILPPMVRPSAAVKAEIIRPACYHGLFQRCAAHIGTAMYG